MTPNPIRVLMVEDNPADAGLIQGYLGEADGLFITQIATSLVESYAYLGKGDVDVILLDLSLPDIQGLDTFKAIHTGFPDKPIIILAGLDDEEFALEAVRSGAQDYLRKEEIDSKLLARSVSYAIDRNWLQTELFKLVITDELTGLLNKRGFLLIADHLRQVAKRSRSYLALVMIDLDKLKTINETISYQMGNHYLTTLASILVWNLRSSDLVTRWGGDEFLVLAIESPTGTPEKMIERLKKHAEDVQSNENFPIPLSFSAGFALEDPASEDVIDSLIETASQMLLEEQGKKRDNE